MALQELRVNKLRTFLSLFGITIGIFCIIGVLATVGSLEQKIQTDINALGSNTIYLDKWDYGGGNDYPWWKYVNRPKPTYNEVNYIKQRASLVGNATYFQNTQARVKYEKNELTGVSIYCVGEDFNKIQTINIEKGRYLNETEFDRGVPVGVIGHRIAEELYGSADKAIGKVLIFDKKYLQVVGVVEKQGQSFVGGFDYDNAVITAYRFFAQVYDTKDDNAGGIIMIQGKKDVPSVAVLDELRGVMRQIRRLSPKTEDNFTLNDINQFSQQVGGVFKSVNIGGWAIAFLSLIVGAFGVANIMFVTVRERTSQIGLKKAIGAKRSTILTEFLLESAFLCIIGGLLGLFFVWLIALLLSSVMPFKIIISGGIILLAFTICVVLGILAGILPASAAAKMDPVVAIRTK
ncbi:MAG: FtsX-like permease family protein [Bacteroidetes bacterium]|nr:MAG: FtsX-like permease family protein [Bacteroidota bacterium]TAF91668.1 MAG: FtsX-like permease family protein [Bacteroidota bacterium]